MDNVKDNSVIEEVNELREEIKMYREKIECLKEDFELVEEDKISLYETSETALKKIASLDQTNKELIGAIKSQKEEIEELKSLLLETTKTGIEIYQQAECLKNEHLKLEDLKNQLRKQHDNCECCSKKFEQEQKIVAFIMSFCSSECRDKHLRFLGWKEKDIDRDALVIERNILRISKEKLEKEVKELKLNEEVLYKTIRDATREIEELKETKIKVADAVDKIYETIQNTQGCSLCSKQFEEGQNVSSTIAVFCNEDCRDKYRKLREAKLVDLKNEVEYYKTYAIDFEERIEELKEENEKLKQEINVNAECYAQESNSQNKLLQDFLNVIIDLKAELHNKTSKRNKVLKNMKII